jgi:hypothetical protein
MQETVLSVLVITPPHKCAQEFLGALVDRLEVASALLRDRC